MRRVLALLLALVLLVPLTGCRDKGLGKGFRLPIDSEPKQLDPQIATDDASVTVLSSLFEGLTRLDDSGAVVEGAASWKISSDGLTYTFTLKESYWSTLSVSGQTAWSQPTRVVADDFLFGMQRTLSPDNRSGTANALYGIKNARAVHQGDMELSALGVTAVNSSVLTITLEQADPSFLARLATTPFMPCNRKFFDYTAGRYGLEAATLLSNGPFSLTAWNHHNSLLLNKNDRYHAASSVIPSSVRFVIGTKDAASALTNGGLDAAVLTAAEATKAKNAGATVRSWQDAVRGVYFNTSVPVLGNADVRRALRDAIEWSTVYSHLTAAGESKATAYIPPAAKIGKDAYHGTHSYTVQADTARAALGKGLAAVYPDNSYPSMPTLTFLAAQDSVSADTARYIVQSWQKNLKIQCTLELVSADTLTARVTSGNYQIALYTAVGGGLSAADNLAAYTTNAAGNLTGFSDAAFDAAVSAATRGAREQVNAAEAMLRTACPVIELSFPSRYYGVAANCENVSVRPFGGGAYNSAYVFLRAKKFDD